MERHRSFSIWAFSASTLLNGACIRTEFDLGNFPSANFVAEFSAGRQLTSKTSPCKS